MENDERGNLRVRSPNEEVMGGPKTVRDEHRRAAHINSGNDWRWALFVGGRRIVGDRERVMDLIYMEESFELTVNVE